MTLDEAIIHAESKARRNEVSARIFNRHGGSYYDEMAKSCKACADEHRQLAAWLKELKEYRKELGKSEESE